MNEVVSVTFITSDAYYTMLTNQNLTSSSPNPSDPSSSNTTSYSITDPTRKPTGIDLSGCRGGTLEYIEYIWVYTGTCDADNSSANNVASRSHLANGQLINKAAVNDFFSKAKTDTVVYHFFRGLIDAGIDELNFALELIMRPEKQLKYLYDMAVMYVNYLNTKNTAYLQPIINDLVRDYVNILDVSKELIAKIQQPGCLEKLILEVILTEINSIWATVKSYDSSSVNKAAYGIGYIALSFISPTRKLKAVSKIEPAILGKLKTAPAGSLSDVMKTATSVSHGDQFIMIGKKKTKALKSNVKYVSDYGYVYYTDGKGRIAYVDADLTNGNGIRNPNAQLQTGGTDRLPDDHGGHLIARIFNGSGDSDNLIAMNGNLNQGEFKKLENRWATALNEGKSVKVKITPIYEGTSVRPTSFKIEHNTNSRGWDTEELQNKAGG